MHTQDADGVQEMEKLVGVIFYYVLIRMFLKEKNMLCTMSSFPMMPGCESGSVLPVLIGGSLSHPFQLCWHVISRLHLSHRLSSSKHCNEV